MKHIIPLTILFVAVSLSFSESLFSTVNSKIEIKGFLDLEESQFSEEFLKIDNQGVIFTPYSLFQNKAVKLTEKSANHSPVELKIWGKWSSDAPSLKKNKAIMKFWRSTDNPITQIVHYSHKPKLDELSGLFIWSIPLGKYDFSSKQAIHFTLPEWADGEYFLVNKISVTRQNLNGFAVETSGKFNESILSQNFTINSESILSKFLNKWFLVASGAQLIIAILLVRYYLAAQAYLILVVFFIIANFWFDFPYDSEKFRRGVFLEHSSKLRAISQSGFHVTDKIDSEFVSEFEIIRANVKDSVLRGSTLKSLEVDLENISEKLGIEMLVYDGETRLLLNSSHSHDQPHTDKKFIQSLNLVYGLAKESINFRYSKFRKKERQKRLNKRISATSDLLEGFVSHEKILTELLNNPNQLIQLKGFDTDGSNNFFWGYTRISGSQLILFFGRRNISRYKLSLLEKVRKHLHEQFKTHGYLDYDIFLRHRNGSPYLQSTTEDSNFLRLHEYYTDVTEFSHCGKLNGKYYFYFGSTFESLLNYRLLIRISATEIFSRLIENEKELTHYRLSFLCLPFLALAISSVIGWRIAKLKNHLAKLLLQDSLEKMKIEGKDQITDLTRQVNSILEVPIRRSRLKQLKIQRMPLDDGLKGLTKNQNIDGQAIYVLLYSPAQTIPKVLDRHVLWSVNEDFQYYRGWMDYLEFDNFINSLKQAQSNEIFSIQQCGLVLFLTSYHAFDYDSASIGESPQLIPAVDFNFDDLQNLMKVSSQANNISSSLLTNLNEADRDKLSNTFKSHGESWKKVNFGSVDGFQLY